MAPRRRRGYPTDLTDAQWADLQPLLKRPPGAGRPTTLDLRVIVNALLYFTRTGCQWRLLPADFPNWPSVRYYFDKWARDGTWQRINDHLRERVRVAAGRAAQPSGAILDSQSVKSTEAGGDRGWDGGRKVKGRKRHILVDTFGFLLVVVAHTARFQDRDGAALVFAEAADRLPSLRKVWADQAYRGDLEEAVRQGYDFDLEIVRAEPAQRGFVVHQWRWIVETTQPDYP